MRSSRFLSVATLVIFHMVVSQTRMVYADDSWDSVPQTPVGESRQTPQAVEAARTEFSNQAASVISQSARGETDTTGTAVEMKFCPFCGNKLVAGPVFCSACGKKIPRLSADEGSRKAPPNAGAVASAFGEEKTSPALVGPTERQNITEHPGGGAALDMVWIPGGTFQMGSPESEAYRDSDEGPVHAVTLDGFWMGKYEVTQEEYESVMGANPSHFRDARNPVEMVSWNDAMEFCRRLSDRAGTTFTLPTEAQWEYACRAGTTTPFSFGETISTGQANHDGNHIYGSGSKGEYRRKTTPVGGFPPNAFGLCDMHGNVWEWCADWYGGAYYASSSSKNPAGLSDGQSRVLRGGSWLDYPQSCRSADRIYYNPSSAYVSAGFRVVVACGTRR